MKKILITGVYGQDGTILSKILKYKKYDVYGTSKKLRNKNTIKGIKYIKCNLNRINEVNKILKKIRPNCIVHLGSKNPSFKELKKKKDFYNENLKDVKNLVNSIIINDRKIKLIFPGSSQMYGNIKKKVDENEKFKPMNSYARFRVDSHNYIINKKKKI